jgi:hypothetical protein
LSNFILRLGTPDDLPLNGPPHVCRGKTCDKPAEKSTREKVAGSWKLGSKPGPLFKSANPASTVRPVHFHPEIVLSFDPRTDYQWSVMKKIISTLLVLTVAWAARAAIQTQTIEYKQGDATLEGVLVYDDAVKTKRPGILIVHQWKGVTDNEKKRAAMLAELGYVAFCADIYGKGIRPPTPAMSAPLRASSITVVPPKQ